MRQGNWIPVDKRFIHLLPKDREFTYLEAMISYSVNRDNGRSGTINGYAERWKWSRDKVRRFIRTIENGTDYLTDGHKTGKRQVIRYVFNKLEDAENTPRHPHTDTHTDTIKDPDPESLNPKSHKEKGAQPGLVLYPLSFLNYLKSIKDFDREKAAAVDYYLRTYKRYLNDEHPHLKPDQWDHVMSTIFLAYDPDNDREAFVEDYEAITQVIEKHFQTTYEMGCDYNILHFVSGKIIYLRACECGYY